MLGMVGLIMNNNTYSIAILIVGSLYWDKSRTRERWRNNRLILDRKEFVFTPIRYGRKSSSREYTYTMVFSQLCYRKDYGLGKSMLIPCKCQPRSAADIIKEAAELWRAERDKNRDLDLEVSRDWGAVGLAINPLSKVDDSIITCWTEHYQSRANKIKLDQAVSEKPIIKGNGILNIRWPTKINNNKPVDVDLILATITKPSLIRKRYPTARQIAQAWREDESNNVEYFEKNIENGISTFQDEQIKIYLYK